MKKENVQLIFDYIRRALSPRRGNHKESPWLKTLLICTYDPAKHTI